MTLAVRSYLESEQQILSRLLGDGRSLAPCPALRHTVPGARKQSTAVACSFNVVLKPFSLKKKNPDKMKLKALLLCKSELFLTSFSQCQSSSRHDLIWQRDAMVRRGVRELLAWLFCLKILRGDGAGFYFKGQAKPKILSP